MHAILSAMYLSMFCRLNVIIICNLYMLHKMFHALADVWRGFIFSTCLLLQESSFPFYFFSRHIFSATRSGVGVLFFMFLLVGTLLYVSPFFPLRLPCGGAVLHKVKTLQRMGIYADVISLRFLCFPCQSWRLR